MSTLIQDAARQELERRRASGVSKIRALLSTLAPKQRAFIEDKSRFKIARASRQSGKSHADAAYLIIECLETPNTPTLYLGLTRDSAKGAIWGTLMAMLEGLKIEHEAVASSLLIKFPNGSFIQLFGADAANAAKRLRGRKYKLVVVDEMGFYLQADALVESLMPTLAILKGTLAMTSSPGYLLSGLFYEADIGSLKERWSQYHWTLIDNPIMQGPASDPKYANRAEEELDTICRMQFNGNRAHPGFRREYLGEWVRDASSLVYPYTGANIIPSEQPYIDSNYALGANFSTPYSAIVVMKYSPYSRKVQIVETWKKENMLVDQVSAKLKEFMDRYSSTIIVVTNDGNGKSLEKELSRRYQIGVQAADKTDKSWYQKIMQNDIISGYVQVIEGLPILAEWDTITKDSSGDEIRGPSNTLADAALYVYRRIYTAFLKNVEVKKTDEEMMIERLEEQFRIDDDTPWYEKE